MPLTKLTNIFQLSTAPNNLSQARVHVGGWSESFWTFLNPNVFNPLWARQQAARSLMLPQTAAIVGYRTQAYTIVGNKLIPGGATSGRQTTTGRLGNVTDLPQVSLQASCAANAAPNSSRLTFRGIPDIQMQGGEYQPDPTFAGFFTLMANQLIGNNFGFVGRDLLQASVRILAIAGNSITLSSIPGTGLAVGDFVRLHRVIDPAGFPVIGVFNVLTINNTTGVITVQGLNANVTEPSGTLRRDLLNYYTFASITPIRAVVKKVGSPSERYRGRRSRRRV